MKIVNLFPTPIYVDSATTVNYDKTQIEVKDCIDKVWKDKDWDSVSYITEEAKLHKVQAKNTEEYLHTNDNVINKYKLENLRNRIFEALDRYLQHVNWNFSGEDSILPNRENNKWMLKSSWLNFHKKGSNHDIHCHPGYTIAGVYYFRVNEEQGGILFNNPNPVLHSGGFPEGQISPQCIEYVPNDGDILLFPAWLQHGTVANESDTEERISLAFNISTHG